MTGWNRDGRRHTDFPAAVRRQAQRQLPAQCAECRATNVPLELDHIIAGARGGSNTISNAQWLCVPCNTAKARIEAAEGSAIRNAKRTLPKRPHPLDRMMPG